MVALDELKARFVRRSRRIWSGTGPHATSYRPEIDGLRAIAVLAVMLFHAEIPGFSGGYVGVDIFFVISGFLITSIIVGDLNAGRFSLVGFYTRRVRRIVPALALVTLACVPVAWFLMLPQELEEFSEALIAVATFSSNVLFWLRTNYFALDASSNPLLHTWSLAVEEQFYVAYPLFIVLLWRVGKRAIAPVLTLLLAASLLGAQLATRDHAAAAFILTPFRIWELLAGALAANVQSRLADRRWYGGMLAAGGIGLVLASVVLLRVDSPVPGLVALPVVAGTALLLLFGRAETVVGRCLATPALVGIGLISYSLYLWHQPLLAFGRIATFDQLSLVQRTALMLAAFPLAYVSWQWVERPFRDRRRVRATVAWTGAALFTAVAVGLGYAGYKSDGFYDIKMGLVPADMRRYVINRPRELGRRNPVWNSLRSQSARPFGSAAAGGRVLILGDSKSEDLYVATQMVPQLFNGLTFRRQKLGSRCMREMVRASQGKGLGEDDSSRCRSNIEGVLAARLVPASDTIVLVAEWTEPTYAAGASLAAELRRRGKRVIIVGTADFIDPPSLSMRLAKRHITPVQAEHYFWENKWKPGAATSEELRALVAREPGIEFRSAYDLYCDEKHRRCRLYDDAGRPLMFDYGHVTIEGSRFMARRLSELGWFNARPEPGRPRLYSAELSRH